MNHTEDGPPLVDEADGDGAAPPSLDVVARAIVGVDHPHRSPGGAGNAACLLPEETPLFLHTEEHGPHDLLGLGVRGSLVVLAAGSGGPSEVSAQQVARGPR